MQNQISTKDQDPSDEILSELKLSINPEDKSEAIGELSFLIPFPAEIKGLFRKINDFCKEVGLPPAHIKGGFCRDFIECKISKDTKENDLNYLDEINDLDYIIEPPHEDKLSLVHQFMIKTFNAIQTNLPTLYKFKWEQFKVDFNLTGIKAPTDYKINSLFCDESGKIFFKKKYFASEKKLIGHFKAKQLETTMSPKEAFWYDPFWMIRGLRFIANKGYTFGKNEQAALGFVSYQITDKKYFNRIYKELNKIKFEKQVIFINTCEVSGFIQQLFPFPSPFSFRRKNLPTIANKIRLIELVNSIHIADLYRLYHSECWFDNYNKLYIYNRINFFSKIENFLSLIELFLKYNLFIKNESIREFGFKSEDILRDWDNINRYLHQILCSGQALHGFRLLVKYGIISCLFLNANRLISVIEVQSYLDEFLKNTDSLSERKRSIYFVYAKLLALEIAAFIFLNPEKGFKITNETVNTFLKTEWYSKILDKMPEYYLGLILINAQELYKRIQKTHSYPINCKYNGNISQTYPYFYLLYTNSTPIPQSHIRQKTIREQKKIRPDSFLNYLLTKSAYITHGYSPNLYYPSPAPVQYPQTCSQPPCLDLNIDMTTPPLSSNSTL